MNPVVSALSTLSTADPLLLICLLPCFVLVPCAVILHTPSNRRAVRLIRACRQA